jgi:hypothetical protein
VIKVKIDGGDSFVEIGGKEVEILDCWDESTLAQCDLSDLAGESGPFPEGLQLEVHSEDGFGTYFFHELLLSYHLAGAALDFRCHTPNKYWEGLSA